VIPEHWKLVGTDHRRVVGIEDQRDRRETRALLNARERSDDGRVTALTSGLQPTAETTGATTICTVLTSGFCASVELRPFVTVCSAEQAGRTARSRKRAPGSARKRARLLRGEPNRDRVDDVEVAIGRGAHAADFRARDVERRALDDVYGGRLRLRRGRDGQQPEQPSAT
jgi:hypothetical protein